MSVMDPAMEAALGGPNPVIFGAVEIVLPGHTVRLLTGSGVISFDGKTFTGRDSTYGVLHSVEDLTEGTGDEAPALDFTLIPSGDAAAADLANAGMQGSSVTAWLGVVDPASGLVIGEPLMIFAGELDVPTLRAGANSRLLDYEVTSVMEDFFLNDDGARLNGDFHAACWPGETGLDHVTNITQMIYWGTDSVSGVTVG